MRVFLALGAASLGALAAGNPRPVAQDQTRTVPQFRTSIQLVLLDVAVLDRSRAPIRDLQPFDFTIVEDGRPQRLVSFSEVAVPEPDGSLVSWMREIAPDVRTNSGEDRRVVLIVLDDATVPFRSTEYVKKIGRAVIDRLGPSDVASVIYTAAQKKSQEFTNDHSLLRAAVDRYVDTMIPDDLQQAYSIGTLRKAVEYLLDVPQRRKAAIFVSGVQLDFAAGAAASDLSTAGAAEKAATSRDRRWEMRDLFEKAQRANVSLYPINPNGLEVLTEPGRDLTTETLQTLANDTGGFAVVNTNSFDSQIAQMFRETGSYYLLGFESEHADGKFRKIDVRVNRPGVLVRTRSGYVSPNGEMAAKPAKPNAMPAPLVKAISGVLPTTDLAMRVTVAPFAPVRGDDAALAITLGLREPVAGTDERVVEDVELVATAFSPAGKIEASRRQTGRLILRPIGAEAKYEVLSRLDLKPGRYVLRFAAHSRALAKSGSVYHDIDIADFTKRPVSLSGIVVGVEPSLPAAPKDFLASLTPVVPTTQRVFFRDVHAPTAFVRVYQGGRSAASISLHTTIVNERDQRVFDETEPVQFAESGKLRAADHTFKIPIGGLASGSYLLAFDASDGRDSARQNVRFIVR